MCKWQKVGCQWGRGQCRRQREGGCPTGDSHAVRLPPYRLSVQKEVEKMLIIESSTSDLASPIIVHIKDDALL